MTIYGGSVYGGTAYRARPAASAAASPSFGTSPPGTPEIRFSAQNVDGLFNTTLSDGAAIGTWKNWGSLGSAADAVQATAGNKPTFRLVAASGKINNLSAVQFDGGDWLQSAAFTSIPQPMMTAAIVRYEATGTVTCDGSAGARHVIYTNPFWSLYAGAGPTSSATVANATQFEQLNTVFNGASTTLRVNKADAVVLTPGTHGLDMITLGANYDGSGGISGYLVELLVWATPPTAASVEAWFDTNYNTTWPS